MSDFPDLELFEDYTCTKPLKAFNWKEPVVKEGHIAISEVFLKNVTDHDFIINEIVPPDPRMKFSVTHGGMVYAHSVVKLVLKYEVPKSKSPKDYIENVPLCGPLQVKGLYVVKG